MLNSVDNETTILRNYTTAEVKKLMEILHLSDDIDLQLKLFSTLAMLIISDNTHKHDIIVNDALYDKIHNVLGRGLPLQSARMLNFISALVYVEDDTASTRVRSLALRAQNMLRASGCLAIMANMFTNNMLRKETWIALCRCLAESCRDSVENQTYCSHLVPICIQKIIHGDLETMLTLKSLINNHTYNMKLFFECNGIMVFERKELFQYETLMQLLNLVIQQAPKEMLSILHSNIFQILEYYKKLYGTQSKIGQWAIVNLYDINNRYKSTTKGFNTTKNNDVNNVEKIENVDTIVDIGCLKPNDTVRLIQNVIREIQQFNTNNNVNYKSPKLIKKLINTEEKKREEPNNMSFLKQVFTRNNERQFQNSNEGKYKTRRNEMSFSFLLKQQSLDVSVKGFETSNSQNNLNFKENSKPIYTRTVPTYTRHTPKRYHSVTRESLLWDSMAVDDVPSILDFQPLLASTPKHIKRNSTVIADFTQSTRAKRCSRKIYKKSINHSEQINMKKQLTQRSISTRVFDAINDSCTTFVKTFKNIFKTKKKYGKQEKEQNTNTINGFETSCSYSFTKYMLQRDDLLSRESTMNKNTSSFKKNLNLCNTCNDTGNLKRKIVNDSYLKDTVSKLKLGINLYGCDFKKISRAMWPRETYMTPEVLYNLYRKLVVK